MIEDGACRRAARRDCAARRNPGNASVTAPNSGKRQQRQRADRGAPTSDQCPRAGSHHASLAARSSVFAGGRRARELAAQPAAPHDQHAIRHAEDLRQLGRNHDDAIAGAARIRWSRRARRPWRQRRCPWWAHRGSAPPACAPATWRCTTFCWLPPERLCSDLLRSLRAGSPSRSIHWRASAAFAAAAHQPRGARRREIRQRDVRGDRERQDAALGLRDLPAPARCPRACRSIRCRDRRARAPEQHLREFGAPRAHAVRRCRESRRAAA